MIAREFYGALAAKLDAASSIGERNATESFLWSSTELLLSLRTG